MRDTFALLAHLPQTSHVTLAVSAAIVVLIFLVARVPASPWQRRRGREDPVVPPTRIDNSEEDS